MMHLYTLITQGGSSTTFDAQHAFDSGKGSGSSYSIVFLFVGILIFIVVLYLWGGGKSNR